MKNVKRLVAAIVCSSLLAPACLHAQNQLFRLGVKGGMNLMEMSFSTSDLMASNCSGFFVGPIARFNVPLTGLGFNVAALYDQRESMVNEETIVIKTLDVPANLRLALNFGGLANVFVEAGPQLAFTLGDRTLTFTDKKLGDIDWNLNQADFSVNLGAGLTIRHIQVGLNYNIPMGKTDEFTWKDAFDNVVHTSAKTQRWQVSAAIFF